MTATDNLKGANLATRRVAFIERAKQIWGTEYCYLHIDYVNSNTPIALHCKKHGEFLVRPANHNKSTHPCGCPKCSKEKQAAHLMKPFASFLRQARAVHGERYTYLEDTYQGSKAQMTIVCPEHGQFKQQPDSHLNGGNGCKKCATTLNLQKIRQQSGPDVALTISQASGNKVKLHVETFKRVNSTATFTCDEHGTYVRLVNSAMNSKFACVECSKEDGWFKYSEDEYRQKVVELVPEGVRLVFLDFKGSNESRIRLFCDKHGEFEKLGASFRANPGCPTCGAQLGQPARTRGLRKRMESTRQSRFEDWLQRAQKKHKGKFDYSQVNFQSQTSPVKIICPDHGIFEQPPHQHLHAGCRLCADEQLSGAYSLKVLQRDPVLARSPGLLYYVMFEMHGKRFYKVGVTIRDVKTRFSYATGQGVKVNSLATAKASLYHCYLAEQYLLEKHVQKNPFQQRLGGRTLASLRIGQTETFSTPLPPQFFELNKVIARFKSQQISDNSHKS